MTDVTAGHTGHVAGPYLERRRADWAELAASAPMTLDADTLLRLRGLSDPTSLTDVREVYLPLTGLLSRYVALHRRAARRHQRLPPAVRRPGPRS